MIEYPTRVRIPSESEEEELMELCRSLHQENGIFSLDEDKVRNTLRRAFNNNGGILGVIGPPGRIEAIICIVFGEFWYSKDNHLEEYFSYVKPEFRKSKNALDLVQFAKWCSEKTGMKLIIGIMSYHRTAGKVRLYQRAFSYPIGAFFLYPRNSEV